MTISCLSPFQIFKKAYLQNLKYLGQFFAYTLFKYFKKAYLKIWKYLGLLFCLSLFQIFKEAYLQIWKYLGQFFAYTLFKYLKKHTYESENTWDNLLLIPFSNITNLKNTSFYTNNNLHKSHYTNNSHKNHYKHKSKYVITASIPKITIKNFYFL